MFYIDKTIAYLHLELIMTFPSDNRCIYDSGGEQHSLMYIMALRPLNALAMIVELIIEEDGKGEMSLFRYHNHHRGRNLPHSFLY